MWNLLPVLEGEALEASSAAPSESPFFSLALNLFLLPPDEADERGLDASLSTGAGADSSPSALWTTGLDLSKNVSQFFKFFYREKNSGKRINIYEYLLLTTCSLLLFKVARSSSLLLKGLTIPLLINFLGASVVELVSCGCSSS